ncbi:DUF5084 family protein [Mammaliicoccus sp. Dog046]|uniref:DUF5084 family protein n=1 Tax=Mammaliicoccus sp. Dog046 TaxID=3034233 RepID=UPI002B25EF29|nr:DUF5084 family protein [Mammaliicoccus sp. Dog046]WQK85601.1 DUF5084 family protein [Mammaliicoccus sp. Dog046]
MKHSWWIILVIGGVMSLLTIKGLVLGVGCFGMIALNAMWLIVYTPKRNSQALESISKPTVYLSILGVYVVMLFMTFMIILTMNDSLHQKGIHLYGNAYNTLNIVGLVIGAVCFTIGTYFVYKIQNRRLNA